MITQDGTMTRINKEAPMPRDKIKPPAETKAQLMAAVIDKMQDNGTWFTHDGWTQPAIEFLLNFFTAADLVGIREELRK